MRFAGAIVWWKTGVHFVRVVFDWIISGAGEQLANLRKLIERSSIPNGAILSHSQFVQTFIIVSCSCSLPAAHSTDGADRSDSCSAQNSYASSKTPNFQMHYCCCASYQSLMAAHGCLDLKPEDVAGDERGQDEKRCSHAASIDSDSDDLTCVALKQFPENKFEY